LAAAKIHIPVVHIEAGLRSFHKAMPEEINRITADHMSTLLFVPTQAGMSNLAKEGFELSHKAKATIDAPNVYHCGDVMYDNSLYFAELSAQKSTIISDLSLSEQPFILCTIHRDSNTDNASALQGIFEALLELVKSTQMSVILPLHPRTRGKIKSLLSPAFQELLKSETRIQLIEPASFLDMIALEKNARLIVTDSGGVQKEAYFFAKPCVILREQTEWVEVVEAGAAILTGAHTAQILDAAQQLLALDIQTDPAIFGDGYAATFICEKICSDL
jgi:UDP-GlcNAc3NAcA epimerase